MGRRLKILLMGWAILIAMGCQLADNRISGKINSSQQPPTLPSAPVVQSISNQTHYLGDSVNITPSYTGEVTLFELSPATLPNGLSFDSGTGAISGVPTAAAIPQTFTLSAIGAGGSVSTDFLLEVGYSLSVNSTTDGLPNSQDISPGDTTCLDGNGFCSLRAALEEAKALSPYAVKISVPAGTYLLSASLQVTSISNNINVSGADLTTTIIDGGNSFRIFDISANNDNVDLTFSDLTFQNGSSLTNGGAFKLSRGTNTFTDCLFNNNVVTNGQGGAIWANSLSGIAIDIRHSQFINNSSTDTTNTDGGAIMVGGNNHVLAIANSYFEGNTVGKTWAGGAIGISNSPGSEIHIDYSTFLDNGKIGGGGIALSGYCTSDLSKTCTVKNSTFVASSQDNHLFAINAVIPLVSPKNTWQFENNTFFSTGSLSMVYNDGYALAHLTRNIFYSSATAAACENDWGITSLGYNIEHTNICGFNHSEDLTTTDPLLSLSGLTDNGGPTPTIALQPLSPAIDAIPPSECTLTNDQRGLPRPSGGGCDIGAVEMQQ